jgi:outer membrane protein OmpA-like peptidoglycan-associated protein
VNQNPVIKTLYGPTDFGCGGFEWLVEFTLPEPSEHYGWIVQQITRTSNIRTADRKQVLLPDTTYWEAWPVKRGTQSTSTRLDPTADGRLYDDSFDHEPFPQTQGRITILGVAKFYETDLPAGFKKNNPLTAAQSLYSSATKPDFWDGSGTAHNLWLSWDCTPGNSASNLLVQAGLQFLRGTRVPDMPPPSPEVPETHVMFNAMEAYKVPSDALFGFDRADIMPGSEKALQQAAEYIKAFKGPNQKVEITGHTDSIGDRDYNKKLSWQRANAVAQWLISHRVLEAKDVRTDGAGATTPLVPNRRPDGSDDPAGRARNRRVEIIVRT